jgi:hypothetical protein
VTAAPAARIPDEDGLFSAMCIAPATYSRNQFFELHRDPRVRRVKRRAALVRGLARQIATLVQRGADHQLSVATRSDGFEVELRVPELGLRRRTRLSSLERDVLDYLLSRAISRQAPEAVQRIELALSRLGGLPAAG